MISDAQRGSRFNLSMDRGYGMNKKDKETKARKKLPAYATTKKHKSKKRYQRKDSKNQIDDLIRDDS